MLVVLALAANAWRQGAQPSLRLRMLAAEDARDASAAGIAPLLEGLQDANPAVQRQAVRALGRFETVSLVPHIQRMLSANDASVRAEAANALAQAYHPASPGAAAQRSPGPRSRGRGTRSCAGRCCSRSDG